MITRIKYQPLHITEFTWLWFPTIISCWCIFTLRVHSNWQAISRMFHLIYYRWTKGTQDIGARDRLREGGERSVRESSRVLRPPNMINTQQQRGPQQLGRRERTYYPRWRKVLLNEHHKLHLRRGASETVVLPYVREVIVTPGTQHNNE